MITNNGGLDSILNESKMNFKRGQIIRFKDGDKVSLGKYVMAASTEGYIIINMGGSYGIPKVVSLDNVLTADSKMLDNLAQALTKNLNKNTNERLN